MLLLLMYAACTTLHAACFGVMPADAWPHCSALASCPATDGSLLRPGAPGYPVNASALLAGALRFRQLAPVQRKAWCRALATGASTKVLVHTGGSLSQGRQCGTPGGCTDRLFTSAVCQGGGGTALRTSDPMPSCSYGARVANWLRAGYVNRAAGGRTTRSMAPEFRTVPLVAREPGDTAEGAGEHGNATRSADILLIDFSVNDYWQSGYQLALTPAVAKYKDWAGKNPDANAYPNPPP